MRATDRQPCLLLQNPDLDPSLSGHAVKDHGVREEVLTGMFNASKAFFALPMEQKESIVVNKWNRWGLLSLLSCSRVQTTSAP